MWFSHLLTLSKAKTKTAAPAPAPEWTLSDCSDEEVTVLDAAALDFDRLDRQLAADISDLRATMSSTPAGQRSIAVSLEGGTSSGGGGNSAAEPQRQQHPIRSISTCADEVWWPAQLGSPPLKRSRSTRLRSIRRYLGGSDVSDASCSATDDIIVYAHARDVVASNGHPICNPANPRRCAPAASEAPPLPLGWGHCWRLRQRGAQLKSSAIPAHPGPPTRPQTRLPVDTTLAHPAVQRGSAITPRRHARPIDDTCILPKREDDTHHLLPFNPVLLETQKIIFSCGQDSATLDPKDSLSCRFRRDRHPP